ncbi:phosphatase PAP2 family protein [Delftia tsuruhatensis]|uniref:phosphatase PAP2 family protein n=1 Tax=Delftia tsuruhatensis TaxID=180282 RepID=UPI00387EC7AF
MRSLDLALFQWMAAGHDPSTWLLAVARLTAVGGAWITLILMGWAAWRQPSLRSLIFISLVACGAAAQLAHFIAASLNFPRPFVLGLSPAYIAHSARGSLPSAHATVMFTVAWMFLLRPQLRILGIGLFGIAAITGWARIYVGIHFPLDVVAGLLLGLLLAGVFLGLWRLCQRPIAPATSDNLLVNPPGAQKEPS